MSQECGVLEQVLDHSFLVSVTEYGCWHCTCNHMVSWMSQGVLAMHLTPADRHAQGALHVSVTGTCHWYHTDSDAFLLQIVIDNEMWRHHFEPTGKPAHMRARHLTSS
jgi:hypothetical protein